MANAQEIAQHAVDVESRSELEENIPVTRADLIPFVADGLKQTQMELAREAEAKLSERAALSFQEAPKVTLDSGRYPSVVLDNPDKATTALYWPVKKDVLGVEVSVTSYEELVDLFITAAHQRESVLASFLAVHAVVTAATDAAYRYRINNFDVIGPDGQPVRWALNLLHRAGLKDRVCGPEMMLKMCERCAQEEVGIYLYGSTLQTLEKLQSNLEAKFPGLRVVGVESPPFRSLTPEENQAACDRINASGAGIVFVGLGCPRQDIFAHTNRNRIQAVQLCVGAAFDFHAGNKKMAPQWMQNAGLEWTYRMLQEPRRLFRRYLVTNSIFLALMARRLVLGSNYRK